MIIRAELKWKPSEYEAGPLCRGCMDFEKYGQDCMENDCVTQTEFGLLRRLDSALPGAAAGTADDVSKSGSIHLERAA